MYCSYPFPPPPGTAFAASERLIRFHSPVVGRFYLAAENARLASRILDGLPVYRASEVADLLEIHPALRSLAGCADRETTDAVRTIHGSRFASTKF